MRKPNDRKRPNTQGSVEDKARAAKHVYTWVSKPLIQVPVLDAEGNDTGGRTTVPLRTGKPYKAYG